MLGSTSSAVDANSSSSSDSGSARSSVLIDGHDAADLFACAISGPAAMSRVSWSAPAPSELASLFPGFEVLEMLGRGGMGAVYRARQTSLNRDVAIKILPPDLSNDAEFAERFRREAQTMARLSHPNIVHVYDFGHEPESGLFFLVMEFVDGADLRDLIAGGGMEPDEALRVVREVCEALSHAHASGFAHRDVKPGNVFLTGAGHVKIGDFGLAKLMPSSAAAENAPELTTTGATPGTVDYCAPEILSGSGDGGDLRADIFSLGVMLHELLTGVRPRGNFAPASSKVRVSRRVDAAVLKAIDEDPIRRFASADEFRRALEKSSRGGGRSAWLVLAGVVMIAMILAGILFWKNRDPDPRPSPVAPLTEGALRPRAFSPFVLSSNALKIGPSSRAVAVHVIGDRSPRLAWLSEDRQIVYAWPSESGYANANDWRFVPVSTGATVEAAIRLTNLEGRPAIAYRTSGSSRIRIAVAESTGPKSAEDWRTVEVEAAQAHGGSFDLVANHGSLALAWREVTTGKLFFARESDAWTPVEVDASDAGLRCDLAWIGGRPAIIHASKTDQELFWIRAADSSGSLWPEANRQRLGRTAERLGPGMDSGSVLDFGAGAGVAWHRETGEIFFSWNLDPDDASAWRTVRAFPENQPDLKLLFPICVEAGGRPMILGNLRSNEVSAPWLLIPDSTDPEDRWRAIRIAPEGGARDCAVFGDTLLIAFVSFQTGELSLASAGIEDLWKAARTGGDPFAIEP